MAETSRQVVIETIREILADRSKPAGEIVTWKCCRTGQCPDDGGWLLRPAQRQGKLSICTPQPEGTVRHPLFPKAICSQSLPGYPIINTFQIWGNFPQFLIGASSTGL